MVGSLKTSPISCWRRPPHEPTGSPLSLLHHVPERSSPSRGRSGKSFQPRKRFPSAAPKPRALDGCGPFRRFPNEKGKAASAKTNPHSIRGSVRPLVGRPRAAQQVWSRQNIIGGTMSIATKRGDSGQTSLPGGSRVSIAHPRVECYGTIDELISQLGLAFVHFRATPKSTNGLATSSASSSAWAAPSVPHRTPGNRHSRLQRK
jgi:hypothetical protein